MTNDINQIKQFVEAFEAGTLPRARWTHEAHFVVGLWYLLGHDFETALGKMRRGVIAYNEASGVPNTDTQGYHETITIFYMRALDDFLTRYRGGSQEEVLFQKLLDDKIVRKDYLFGYYSKEVLTSLKARKTWVEPDKRAMPRPLPSLLTYMAGFGAC